MMYAIIAVLFSAFLIWISLYGEKNSKKHKFLILFNAFLSLLGVIILTSVYYVAKYSIFSREDDLQWTEWAWDMFTLYFSISIPVMLTLLVILLISVMLSVFQDKKHKSSSPTIRAMSAVASSVLMLLIAPCYGFMTDNQIVPIYTYILISGFAEALLFRIIFTLEYLIRFRFNVKNK